MRIFCLSQQQVYRAKRKPTPSFIGKVSQNRAINKYIA